MTEEEIQKDLMDEWNLKYERGQKVLVRDNGKEFEAFVTCAAYITNFIAVCILDATDEECAIESLRAMMPCAHCQHSLAEPFPFETDKGEAVCDDCGRERNMQ
jgi:hypothetical protein